MLPKHARYQAAPHPDIKQKKPADTIIHIGKFGLPDNRLIKRHDLLYCISQFTPSFELGYFLCRNLNHFTGLRITPLTGSPLGN